MSDQVALPKAIRTGEFDLCGVTMRVHVLDSGERVIDADSVAELFNSEERELDAEQVAAFAHFMRML